VSDPAFIERVPPGDDRRLARFTERVAEVINALIRGGQLSRTTAANVWGVVNAAVADGSITTAKLAAKAVTYPKIQDVTATARVLGRKTAGAGVVEECTLSDVLDFIGSAAQGDILYRGASGWARLPAGTLGDVLTSGGPAADPSWAAGGGGGGGGSYYTAPVLANFAFVNQGTATATTPATSGGIWVTKPTQGGSHNITQLVRNVPGATWTMVWGYRPACGWALSAFGVIGPSLYDSASGKITLVRFGWHDGSTAHNGTTLNVEQYPNATSNAAGVPFAAVDLDHYRGGAGGYFVKVVNDGTNLRFSFGPDLDVWMEFLVQAVGAYMTPDKVGFGVDAYSDLAGAQLFHHTLTSP
jgi:hypothetical protein